MERLQIKITMTLTPEIVGHRYQREVRIHVSLTKRIVCETGMHDRNSSILSAEEEMKRYKI